MRLVFILLFVLIIILIILCVSWWRKRSRLRVGGFEEDPSDGILATGSSKEDNKEIGDDCLMKHLDTIRKRMLFDGKPVEDKVIIEMFYTDWCPHCKDMEKPWSKLQEELEGDSGYVLLEQNQDYSNAPGVPYIPFVIKHKPGDKKVHHYTGKKEAESLIAWAKELT